MRKRYESENETRTREREGESVSNCGGITISGSCFTCSFWGETQSEARERACFCAFALSICTSSAARIASGRSASCASSSAPVTSSSRRCSSANERKKRASGERAASASRKISISSSLVRSVRNSGRVPSTA